MALRWPNVDLKKGAIQITEAVSRVKKDGKWINEIHTPKSEAGTRTIPLNAAALAEFKKMTRGLGYVFTWPDGRTVDPLFLTHHFTKLIKKNGLDITFHGLRHSFASALLSNNVHPKVVQELLGDSTISVVLDTYSHVAPGLKESAVDKLNEIYTTAPGG